MNVRNNHIPIKAIDAGNDLRGAQHQNALTVVQVGVSIAVLYDEDWLTKAGVGIRISGGKSSGSASIPIGVQVQPIRISFEGVVGSVMERTDMVVDLCILHVQKLVCGDTSVLV